MAYDLCITAVLINLETCIGVILQNRGVSKGSLAPRRHGTLIDQTRLDLRTRFWVMEIHQQLPLQ